MKDYQGKSRKQVESSQASFVYAAALFIVTGCIFFIYCLIKLL